MKLAFGSALGAAACISFVLASSRALAQEVTQHEVEGGKLINGTAMTYDAPKGWTVKTELTPESYVSICYSQDQQNGYLIISSIINPFSIGGIAGAQPIGTPPPDSLIKFLTGFLDEKKLGHVTKVIRQDEKPIPATMQMQGSVSAGRAGFVRVIYTAADDHKEHEAMISAQMQLLASRLGRRISGTWIVNNFFLVSGPVGQLNETAKYFAKCIPSYQFTSEYADARANYFRKNIGATVNQGNQERNRINKETAQMVEDFKKYMQQ